MRALKPLLTAGLALAFAAGIALAGSYYLWDVPGQVWDQAGETWDNTTPSPTPAATNTGTPPTSTPTPSPTNTVVFTATATPTPTGTSTASSTPVNTGTPTQTWTPGGPTHTRTPTFSSGCSHETLNAMPRRDSNFVPDTQNFLCAEDAERTALSAFNFIYQGALPTYTGSQVTLGIQEGFANGGYFYETSNVSLAGNPSTTCWIVASREAFGNVAPFTRVGSTHYLRYCGGSKPLPLTPTLMWIAEATTNGSSNVTGVVDLRGFSPGLRTVANVGELNGLTGLQKGQLAITLNSGELWYFRQDDYPVSIAEWEQVATGDTAILSAGDQNVSGVKTFLDYPQIDPVEAGLAPTLTYQLAPKGYVDSVAGTAEGTSYDPPNLLPGTYTTTTVPLVGVSVGMVCLASHTQLSAIYPAMVHITAYPLTPNNVAVVISNPTGLGVNIPNGTLNIRCSPGS